MCAAVGHPVLKLERIAIGPLQLGDLGRGQYRRLTAAELKALKNLIDQARPASAGEKGEDHAPDRKS